MKDMIKTPDRSGFPSNRDTTTVLESVFPRLPVRPGFRSDASPLLDQKDRGRKRHNGSVSSHRRRGRVVKVLKGSGLRAEKRPSGWFAKEYGRDSKLT